MLIFQFKTMKYYFEQRNYEIFLDKNLTIQFYIELIGLFSSDRSVFR